MSAGLDISAAMTLAKAPPVLAPVKAANQAAATKAAKDFEAVFISQFLGQMFDNIPTDGPFGGGQGEAMFRSMMVDQYGKEVEKRGGLGLSSVVAAELIKMQEAHK